jgi:Uma2 family endonuclease
MAFPQLHPASTIDYPDSDGLPMAESEFQLLPLLYAVAALRTYFQGQANVYVGGNMFIYYEEGNREAVVAPDVFVVIGTPKYVRSSYLLWQEPKGPDFVLEITSASTRRNDQNEKPKTYARLGVREYFQYDPTGDYLVPRLQGLRLVEGTYQPLATTELPTGTLTLHSDVLGLDLRLEGDSFHFYNPMTGQKLLTYEEAEQARQQAEQARQQAEAQVRDEAARRQAAEARLAELEARLQALQATRPAAPPPREDQDTP